MKPGTRTPWQPPNGLPRNNPALIARGRSDASSAMPRRTNRRESGRVAPAHQRSFSYGLVLDKYSAGLAPVPVAAWPPAQTNGLLSQDKAVPESAFVVRPPASLWRFRDGPHDLNQAGVLRHASHSAPWRSHGHHRRPAGILIQDKAVHAAASVVRPTPLLPRAVMRQKLTRLCARLREREWRRYGGMLPAGSLESRFIMPSCAHPETPAKKMAAMPMESSFFMFNPCKSKVPDFEEWVHRAGRGRRLELHTQP